MPDIPAWMVVLAIGVAADMAWLWWFLQVHTPRNYERRIGS